MPSTEINETKESTQKVPFMISFWRSQATSLISSAFDFGLHGFLHYILGIIYPITSPIGNIGGAIVSFYLGRNWAFESRESKVGTQALKYAFTSLSSAGLNTAAIYFISETYHIEPTISKVICAIAVGLTFNFFMFRYFVYNK